MKQLHGPPMKVFVGSKTDAKTQIDHQTLFRIKTETNLSGRRIIKIAQILNEKKDLKIEPFFKEAVVDKNRSLESFFDIQKLEMLVPVPGQKYFTKVEKDFIYCTDIESYVTYIADQRGYQDGDLQVDINMDSGQGSLKVLLAVKELELGDGSFQESPVKKPKVAYKDTGVKKVHILGIGQNIGENHFNFNEIMTLMGIKDLDFLKHLDDLKAGRIKEGCQGHSSTYNCSWCHGIAPFDQPPYFLRTFKSLNDNYQGYQKLCQEIGEAKALPRAKEFKNVVNLPLIHGPDDQQVMEKAKPDGLHIGLGVGNKVVDSLEAAINEDFEDNLHESVYQWMQSHSIVGLAYRGGQLDGPNLRKLYRLIDGPVAPGKKSLKDWCPQKFQPFVDCLRYFYEVEKSCFGMTLDPTWKQKIEDFEKSYRSLNISVTPKVHCVFFEVPILLERHGRPLGHFSTQKFESVHYDFKATLANYHVPEENHPDFGEKLKAAVVAYNSYH